MSQENETHYRKEVLVACEIGVRAQRIGPSPKAFFNFSDAFQLPAPLG